VPNDTRKKFAMSQSEQPSMYSPEIGPMMQDLLQTLANIDFEHDVVIEKLEMSATDAALKRKIGEKLREQHRERREPYIRLLADLHNRAMPRVAAAR
jgi:hypothetical protein